jgi:hypothetical protein
MARRDLTNREIEQMGREKPGSADEYLRLRREELEAEAQQRRANDDRRRFVEEFVAAGGDREGALEELRRQDNERAARTLEATDDHAADKVRKDIGRAL